MVDQNGSVPVGAPMLVSIPQAAPGGQNMYLPPAPPGMAYLVPSPQHEQQQHPALAPKTTDFAGNEVPIEEIAELNTYSD
jgi:hypothetical protein